MEAARASARERAAKEMTEKMAASQPAKPQMDPDQDPDFWKVTKFSVPGRSMWVVELPRETGRFYAKVPRKYLQEGLGVESQVFFYYVEEDGALRIGGRGKVVKIQGQKRPPVIEAEVEACRFTYYRSPPKARSKKERAIRQLTLVPAKLPGKVRWYVSTKLKGPEVESWDPETVRRFALGQPWMGMSQGLLEAMMGVPEDKVDAAGVVSLVYGTGKDAMRYDITDGVVTGRVPVDQF
jgi:hypothetical protein